MIIGFSGTEDGMSIGQFEKFCEEMRIASAVDGDIEFHHGDCIGADKQAHDFMDGFDGCSLIVIHPPILEHFRAFCNSRKAEILDPRNFLDRDMDIAKICDVLISTPFETEEILRSGTWSTIRYARKLNKPVIRIHREGSLIRETEYDTAST